MDTKTSGNVTPVACAWCGGSGKWSIAPGSRAACIVCGGKGAVSVTVPASPCRQCRGSGKSNGLTPCLTCAGAGWEKVAN